MPQMVPARLRSDEGAARTAGTARVDDEAADALRRFAAGSRAKSIENAPRLCPSAAVAWGSQVSTPSSIRNPTWIAASCEYAFR